MANEGAACNGAGYLSEHGHERCRLALVLLGFGSPNVEILVIDFLLVW